MSIYAFTDQELYTKCHQLYEYHDGQLISKKTQKPVGHWSSKDYRITTFVMRSKRFKVLVHRLIFLMHHGYLPEMVDIINGNKTDNRVENLRAATRIQNAMNREKTPRGVRLTKHGTWEAYIQIARKRIYLGTYATPEIASRAYEAAVERWHGAQVLTFRRGEALTGAKG